MKDEIRKIKDYKKKGVKLREVKKIMGNEKEFRREVDEMVYKYEGKRIEKVEGIEERGFIIGGEIDKKI